MPDTPAGAGPEPVTEGSSGGPFRPAESVDAVGGARAAGAVAPLRADGSSATVVDGPFPTVASALPPPPLTRPQRRAAAKGARRRRRRRRTLIVVGTALVLAVALMAAAAGYLWYQNNRIHRVRVVNLSGVRQSGIEKDVENILLIGSTTRCGLKHQSSAFGFCDQGITGVNSDVVMVLHLDPDHHRASILSIPRDTFIANAHRGGVNKIDAALGDPNGPSQLVAAVSEDFGIPIQHYVELNFDSFQGVVDALGGVQMYFPMPVHDSFSTLNVRSTGCQVLNGFQALSVVRARHLQYQPPQDAGVPASQWPADPQSDLSRIRRDHEFLRVLASAVAKRGLGNPITDLQLVDAVAGQLTVDTGFSPRLMASLVLTFHDLNAYQVPQYTLPVVVDGNPQGYTYRGGDYHDVVFPVQPQDSQVVSEFLGTTPSQDTAGRALPDRATITVVVENGSGLSNQGSATSSALRALGYTVTSVTDTQVGAATSEATVLYSSLSGLPAALRLQSDLSGLATIGYDPGLAAAKTDVGATSSGATSGGVGSSPAWTIDVGSPSSGTQSAEVVLVTGSNFAVNAPAPAGGAASTAAPASSAPTSPASTTSTTVSTSSTTTAPGPSSASPLASNSDLSAPSSAVEGLQPWDPRSCTASGGAGP